MVSNYSAWLKDPKHYVPSAQLVWSIVGQDILNSDIGNYFQGIHITSGFNYGRRYNNTVSFKILGNSFTYFFVQFFVLLDLIFICISLICPTDFLRNSSAYPSHHTITSIRFYQLVWTSNSHFATYKSFVRFRYRS